MTHTTTSDFAAYTGQVYTGAQTARLASLLDRAERLIVRRIGVDFFTAGDEVLAPDARSGASKDWVEATSIVTEYLFLNDNPDARADVVGPYHSERIGDYSYTLRNKDEAVGVFSDATLRSILSTYRANRTGPGYTVFTTAGPTLPAGETAEVAR
jgi:hypothetical protein